LTTRRGRRAGEPSAIAPNKTLGGDHAIYHINLYQDHHRRLCVL
jgi:hypothetical protein